MDSLSSTGTAARLRLRLTAGSRQLQMPVTWQDHCVKRQQRPLHLQQRLSLWEALDSDDEYSYGGDGQDIQARGFKHLIRMFPNFLLQHLRFSGKKSKLTSPPEIELITL